MFKRRASAPSGRRRRVDRLELLPEDAAALASHAIDRELDRERAQRSHMGLAGAGISDAALAGLSLGSKTKVSMLLLLGQPNAGKSTFLNQMLMHYNPEVIQAESKIYHLAILLSVVASTRLLLEALQTHIQGNDDPELTPTDRRFSFRELHESVPPEYTDDPKPSYSEQLKDIELRKMRLQPLLDCEQELRDRLGVISLSLGGDKGRSLSEHARLAMKKSHRLSAMSTSTTASSDTFDSGLSFSHPIRSIGAKRSQTEMLIKPAQWRSILHPKEYTELNSLGVDSRSRLEAEARPSRILTSLRDEIRSLFDEVMRLHKEGEHVNPNEGDEQGGQARLDIHELLSESALYFLARLDSIAIDDYTPREQDILNLRIASVGIVEQVVATPSNKIYRVVDVSGAMLGLSSSRRLAEYFDATSAVIFVVDSGEFDMAAPDNPKQNSLMAAVDLFEKMQLCESGPESGQYHPLCEQDRFKRKIRLGRKLANFLPDYEGPPGSYEAARHYLKAKFKKAAMPHISGRHLYCHFLSCLDSRSTRLTINSLEDIICRDNLQSVGLL